MLRNAIREWPRDDTVNQASDRRQRKRSFDARGILGSRAGTFCVRTTVRVSAGTTSGARISRRIHVSDVVPPRGRSLPYCVRRIVLRWTVWVVARRGRPPTQGRRVRRCVATNICYRGRPTDRRSHLAVQSRRGLASSERSPHTAPRSVLQRHHHTRNAGLARQTIRLSHTL